MPKKFSEKTLEELWELFPIFLTEHRTYWKEWFAEEKNRLNNILPQNQNIRISHIGSTSVDTIWAKPIIEKMKLELWKRYEHNRDEYTNAKTKFVLKYTEEAKGVYKDRY